MWPGDPGPGRRASPVRTSGHVCKLGSVGLGRIGAGQRARLSL